MRTRLLLSQVLLANILTLTSCSFFSAPSEEGYTTSARRTKLVESVSGQSVSELAAFRAMVELSRSIAIALRDDQLRLQVYEALHASPYPEHKLHFRTFSDGGVGTQLLSAAAAASGRSLESMRAIRDSAIDLEFYMSAQSHFNSWTGDANILVATAYDPDDDIPVAFNLNGERVTLTSARVAPSIPVLGLVRRESSFAPPGPAALIRQGTPAGIYMTFSYLSDLHEGFLSGSPEIEVFTSWRLSGNDSMQFTQCSGESAGDPNRAGPGIKSSAYEFNQDSHTWSGIVRILDSAQAAAAQAVDSIITYWVWEDDNTRCELHLGGAGDAQSIYQQIVTPNRGWRNRFTQQPQDPILVWIQRAFNFIRGLVSGGSDDFVGTLVDPSYVNQSWSDANMAVAYYNNGVQVGGRVKLLRFDSEPPTPPPSFQVSISGPTTVGPNNYSCGQWLASVQAGQTPYQYEWFGLFSSTDSYVTGTVPEEGGDLYLVVTDNQGYVLGASIHISYDSGDQSYCE